MKHTNERRRTVGEELANAVTHGLGALAILVLTPILLCVAFQRGGLSAAVYAGIFLASALCLYVASTLYHATPVGPVKKVFQSLDHSAIYLLIAGTYTPFMLGILRGPWGWSLFGVVWGLAVIGILQEVLFSQRRRLPTIVLYLAMGWLAAVAIVPLTTHVAFAGLLLIFGGGLAYTLGVVFYSIERIRYFHTIWHLFVLAGTALHFVAVMNYAV